MSAARTLLVALLATAAGRADAQCPSRSAGASASASWGAWGRDLANTRHQPAAAAGLTAADVPRLRLKWAFNLGPVTEARAQPVVADGVAFVGSATGALYA